MPYYERYQESPREVMVELNKLIRSKIQEMMLHVDDLEHYEQIDFLRENSYGKKYARKHGYKFNYLPSRLISDQKLVDALQNASKEHPETMEKVYEDTLKYMEGLKKLNIRDWLFMHNPGVEAPILRGLGLLLLLPLFIASIIPTGLLYLIPKIFLKKMIKDQMFVSTFNVAVSAFVSVPLCLILPVVLLWIYVGFWWALGYFVAFPLMFILSWNYMKLFMKFVGSCNFIKKSNRPAVKELRKLRYGIYKELDSLLA